MSGTSSPPPSSDGTICPRCQLVTLEILDTSESLDTSTAITFYRCPGCTRQYARKPGAGLVDRWLSPISLALYGVIFEPDAVARAPEIAAMLAQERDRAWIEMLANEIQLELDTPTQQVGEILPMAAPKSEEHLRAFLRRVVAELQLLADQEIP